MPEFLMLVGMPGSGKSTWVNYHCSPTTYVYCSTDALIEAYAKKQGKTYNEVFQEHIKEATRQMNIQMQWAFLNNISVILDQTNLTKASRAKKLSSVPKNYYKGCVVIPVPEREEWLRRLDRPGKTIPKFVIENMLKSYEEPTDDEFDEIVRVT